MSNSLTTLEHNVLRPEDFDPPLKRKKATIPGYWTVEEIDLAKDHDDWEKLSDNERHFIKNVLAFFAASDGIVNENLVLNFMSEIKVSEVLAFYSFQNAIETIHSETYSLLIDTYIKDETEKDRLLNSIETIPSIRKKADWAIKWIENKQDSFAIRLVAFACVEGIFFSGAFCSIYWLKEKGLMHGLTFSNELISRDESLHTEFAVLLYSYIVNKLSQEEVHEVISDAVAIEKEFIIESLPCSLLGMNSDLMSEYIEFVADRLVVQLGYDKIYETSNPFDFMDRIGLEDKQNFFEVRVSNYSKAEIHNTKDSKLDFDLDEDF